MIDGVLVTPLTQIEDERGKIMHMLSKKSPIFKKFGEIYFSTVHEGIIKGWHLHKKMILNYAVVYGKIRLVLYDDRKLSRTKGELMEIILSTQEYNLVTIPPMIWNGFEGISAGTSIVANCATIPHDPNEIIRKDPLDKFFPYKWKSKKVHDR